MSQNKQRRSSIRNPQVQNELRNLGNFNIQEILGTTATSGFRLSGSSRGSATSATNKTSMCAIPTPNRFGSAARKAAGSGSAGRPPGNSGTGGKFMPPLHSKFSSTPSLKPPPPINRAPVAKARVPLPARGQPMVGNLTLNSTRRKSKSYESLSLLSTPAFTPRSRSKSPGRSMTSSNRRGGSSIVNEAGDQPKTIKVTKDKEIESRMAHLIFDFLEAQNCQARPSCVKDLKTPPTLPVAKFKAILKFVASHMVGPDFFGKDKGDDDDKIIEVTKILKYPGQLSKSHLKTATAQHAWPACLTFLAWLCCRVSNLFLTPEDRNRAFELSSNGFQETASESYLELFALKLSGELTEESIDRELGNFRARICDLHRAEVTKSVKELEAEKLKVEQQVQQLEAEPNPAKTLQVQLEEETKVLHAINEKIRDVENRCKHSYNVNHIQLEKDSIRLDISTKKQEINKLTQQVNSQEISTEDAAKLHLDNSNLRNQLDCIRNVISQLINDRDKRRQYLQNSEKRLYALITRFSIVEKYNDIVTHLRFENLAIPPNPFSIDELEGWLKNASKTLRKADLKASEMLKSIDSSSDLKKKQSVEYSEQYEKYSRAIDELRIKLQIYEQDNEYLVSEMNEEYEQLLEKVEKEKKAVSKAKHEMNKSTRTKDKSEKILEDWKEKLAKYKSCIETMEGKIAAEAIRFQEREAELAEQLNHLVSTLATAQYEFYHTNYGIDIFGAAPENEESEATAEGVSTEEDSSADCLDNTDLD